MRLKRILSSMFLMIFLANPMLWADDPIIKFARGIENIVTSPLEYAVHFEKLHDAQRTGGIVFIAGTLKGTLFMLYRIVGGAVEAVTFLIPVPPRYEPLMNPPTPYQAVHAQDQIPDPAPL